MCCSEFYQYACNTTARGSIRNGKSTGDFPSFAPGYYLRYGDDAAVIHVKVGPSAGQELRIHHRVYDELGLPGCRRCGTFVKVTHWPVKQVIPSVSAV